MCVAACAAVGFSLVVSSGTPAFADSGSAWSTPGAYAFTVPAGWTEIQVAAAGAAGGADQSTATPGGNGGALTADLAVTPSEVLMIDVGGDGAGAGHSGPTNYYLAGNGGGAGGNGGSGPAGSAGILGLEGAELLRTSI